MNDRSRRTDELVKSRVRRVADQGDLRAPVDQRVGHAGHVA